VSSSLKKSKTLVKNLKIEKIIAFVKHLSELFLVFFSSLLKVYYLTSKINILFDSLFYKCRCFSSFLKLTKRCIVVKLVFELFLKLLSFLEIFFCSSSNVNQMLSIIIHQIERYFLDMPLRTHAFSPNFAM